MICDILIIEAERRKVWEEKGKPCICTHLLSEHWRLGCLKDETHGCDCTYYSEAWKSPMGDKVLGMRWGA
jgi:hypothetical protein